MIPAPSSAFGVLPRRATLAACAVVSAAVVLAARQAAVLAPFAPHPAWVETAVALDLTVVLTFLVWWILARELGWSGWALAPVFLATLALAARVMPDGRNATLRALQIGAAPMELAVMVWAARRARTPGRLHDALAYEAEVLRTALSSRRTPAAVEGALSYHRKSAYGAIVGALLLVTAAEVTAVHLVVSRWSVKAAWLLTALGVYGALWILGDWKACRSRPVEVRDGVLQVRFGLRWKLDVPLDGIMGLRVPSGRSPGAEPPVDLRLALPGARIVVLQLDRPVTAVGIYGLRREVRTLGLGLDEPGRLAELLGGATPRHGSCYLS